jgi:hypothetical protein
MPPNNSTIEVLDVPQEHMTLDTIAAEPGQVWPGLIISKAWAMPSALTFTIKPIAELLSRYVGDGIGWVDPYAGDNSPAEITNDHNPERKARHHLDAEQFCQQLTGTYCGVLFDPPYSYRQVSEHYRVLGKRARSIDTSTNFYNRVMNPICDKIEIGGYAISFGWNTNGFGKNRGFEQIEILIVAHGGHHNDTLCTVERKIAKARSQDSNHKSQPEQVGWFA